MAYKRETKVWRTFNQDNLYEDEHILEAVQMLKEGKIVAFPTETVYGLGADATNNQAVEKIFQAKGRPSDNPLIAHIGSPNLINNYVTEVPEHAKKLIDAFWPGPLTVILKSNGRIANNVTAGLKTVGLRMPDEPHALAILRNVNRPIAAPSANRSGKPSPTTAEHVLQDLNGKIDGLVDGGKTGIGVESTVIDCTTEPPMILRPGGVTKEQIESVIGVVDQIDSEVKESEQPRSPGLKYKHYAPEKPIWLVRGDALKMKQIAEKLLNEGKRVQFLVSEERAEELQIIDSINLGSRKQLNEITANLYNALRKIDSLQVDIVVAESFTKEGIGQALMNRLERAATKII